MIVKWKCYPFRYDCSHSHRVIILTVTLFGIKHHLTFRGLANKIFWVNGSYLNRWFITLSHSISSTETAYFLVKIFVKAAVIKGVMMLHASNQMMCNMSDGFYEMTLWSKITVMSYDKYTYYNIINTHANKSGIIDQLKLHTPSFVGKEKTK